MQRRTLGNSGLSVAPLALGTNVFSWTVDEPMAYRILDRFVDAGLNLIDTADAYPRWAPGRKGGESEEIIGRWMQQSGVRSKVVIATKVGSEMGPGKKGLAAKYIVQAAEDSLRRLRTDHIDLYQSHWDDLATPIEETLGAYGKLIREGKVRAIGASNFSDERLAESLQVSEQAGLPRYESLQPLYNLYDRASFETKMASLCRQEGLGVITYYSLASGFLTGKYRSKADLDKSVRGAKAVTYLDERGLRILDALDRTAKKLHTAPASVALAWLMARPGITAPIASATSLPQLETLIAAAHLELDKRTLRLLDTASAVPVTARTAA